MNPLDPLELKPFLRNLKEEMPIHTQTTAKIKRSYSQGMPKNLMEYSAFVDNHFLNENLAIIEEMQHRNTKHPIPLWFRQYQLRHYAKYGILKGDHFFGPFARIFPDLGEHRGIGFLPYAGITLGFGIVGDTKVLGSDIECGGTTSNSGSNTNYIVAFKKTTGIVGQYYDRIALNVHTANGTYRLACYSSTTTLYAETGAISSALGYNWQALTEFALTGTDLWLAYNTATSTNRIFTISNDGTMWENAGWTYGSFVGSTLTLGADIINNQKIGHS